MLRKRKQRRLGLENLERRELMAADVKLALDGTLEVQGTNNADVIEVSGYFATEQVSVTNYQWSAKLGRFVPITRTAVVYTQMLKARVSDEAGNTLAEASYPVKDVDDVEIEAGAGDDQVDATYATRPVLVEGGAGVDTIFGTAYDDTLRGGDNDDEIHGGGGDDVLEGGLGRNVLKGDAGNDTIVGGPEWDILSGGDGDDHIEAGLFIGDLGPYGDQADRIRGGAGNDTLIGGDGPDSIHGDGGNDEIHGMGGDDLLIGDWGSDTIDGGDGNDVINGGKDDDELHGGDDTDLIFGGGGSDVLYGDGGGDVMLGDGYDAPLTGIKYLNRWVSYWAKYPPPDGDQFGDDTLYGGKGNDDLWGGDGDDTLYGEDDNDQLDGGWGSDTLVGGAGIDSFWANGGANDFYFEPWDAWVKYAPGKDMFVLAAQITAGEYNNMFWKTM